MKQRNDRGAIAVAFLLMALACAEVWFLTMPYEQEAAAFCGGMAYIGWASYITLFALFLTARIPRKVLAFWFLFNLLVDTALRVHVLLGARDLFSIFLLLASPFIFCVCLTTLWVYSFDKRNGPEA
ncbi:MAG TPA: hypothetical protein VMU88_09675 [bacterium]|nr:hypothetical protein [bacterium]